jgi:hypothetical protein
LPIHRPFPKPLRGLLRQGGGGRHNTDFMCLIIRHYNSLFAFTSLGVNIGPSVNTGSGLYVFRINGVVHHRIGSLLPAPSHRPEYAQLYIYDTENEVSNCLAAIPSERDLTPDPTLVASLIQMLNAHNPLVREFRLARDRLMSPTSPDVFIRLGGTAADQGTRFFFIRRT